MRVLVIDDHSIIRMALKHILAELSPTATLTQAASGPDGLAHLREGGYDLVITDLYMPGGGVEAIGHLVAEAAPAPVVVFTVSEAAADVRGALAAGARAYIPKTTEDPLIVSILRLVLAGGTYVPPDLSRLSGEEDGMRPRMASPRPRGPFDADDGGLVLAERPAAVWTRVSAHHLPPLTRRQFQVLELLAEGLSNAEIGTRLGLNLSTVKSHVTGVLRALNVSSRTQAVLAFKQAEPQHR
jgi:DNA-binding NarL/FixJ family response regulator